MTPEFQALVRKMSPKGSVSICELQVFFQNALYRQAQAVDIQADSKRVASLVWSFTDEDLNLIVSEVRGGCFTALASVERDRRKGAIQGWLFRGMTGPMAPDLVEILYAPKEETP